MIIFIDVDGTLVDYENNLPASAIEAIRTARNNGHRVYICTGRSKAEVYDNIWAIGLDGMIGGNGSYVEDAGKVVMHTTLTYDECNEIVNWLHEKNLEYYLESNSGLYGSENFETRGLKVMQEYSKRKGMENSQKITVTAIFPNMIFSKGLVRDDINKISFILDSYDDYLEAKEKFSSLTVGTWGGKGEEALFGDIGIAEIDKAKSIQCLLDYLGEDKENTIAFGDAKIDIPMLEYCKIGVAMGSGGKEIKEMADYITDDVDKDGLFNAFKKYHLI